MDITKDPIFRSIMFALGVVYIALATNSAWAAKGGKPPPEPTPVIAEDVVCDGCVDTADIADGAVSVSELSVDIQSQLTAQDAEIISLQVQIDQLTQSISPSTYGVDATGSVIGKVIGLTMRESHVNAGSNGDYVSSVGFRVKVFTNQGYATMLNSLNGDITTTTGAVAFAEAGCMGQGYASALPGTVYKVGQELGLSDVWMTPVDAPKTDDDNVQLTGTLRLSLWKDGECFTNTWSPNVFQSGMYATYPNDPSVSGIALVTVTDAYPAPITIQ